MNKYAPSNAVKHSSHTYMFHLTEHHRNITVKFTIGFVADIIGDRHLTSARCWCWGRAARTKQLRITLSILLLSFCTSTIQQKIKTQTIPHLSNEANEFCNLFYTICPEQLHTTDLVVIWILYFILWNVPFCTLLCILLRTIARLCPLC